MVVEDKLGHTTSNLQRYCMLFSLFLEIAFLGCRVLQQSQTGLEFLLAYRDRTDPEARLRAERVVDDGWFPLRNSGATCVKWRNSTGSTLTSILTQSSGRSPVWKYLSISM